MKTKKGYILRTVAGSFVVVAVGRLDFNGMITLNETGALLWKRLEQGATEQELIDALLAEYDVSAETAAADVTAFLDKMKGADLLDA